MPNFKRLLPYWDLLYVFVWREFTVRYRHSYIGVIWAIMQPLSIARLGFSIAIHGSAEILLIDEILSVGDESFRNKCDEKIMDLKKEKIIIIVFHSKERLEKTTDRIRFLEAG